MEGGFSYRAIFWVTGFMAFWISPIADNLTTAVLMGAVVSTLGQGEPEYLAMCCVNIVVASNAGKASRAFIHDVLVWSFTQYECTTLGEDVNGILLKCGNDVVDDG